MKKLIILLMLMAQSIFANHTFIGELRNFEDITVSNCEVTLLTNVLENRRVHITEISFLKRSFKNIEFRAFMKNGINGNLYILQKRNSNKYNFILNTNVNFELEELSITAGIGTLNNNYRCVNFYEK